MKKYGFFVGLTIIWAFLTDSCTSNPEHMVLKTREDTLSYYIGLRFGSEMKQSYRDSMLNYDAFARGIYECFHLDDSMLYPRYLAEAYVEVFFDEYDQKQLDIRFRDNKTANRVFLEENAKKDSVVTLPSGLQYIILKEGNGEKPGQTDRVKVHFKSYLIDGTVFDNSYERGSPNIFRLNVAIAGLVEAIQMMSAGSKWRVFIPAELAFGSEPPEGTGILPFSTVIYELELLEVNP
ncbi:MAG: FKBP-type peptidyl-prolyl cis-trans isomerase [Bacteroidales bacterium]|nr:FKBP-type peptidyl-prolyl cis-trans isomerase [Bacteroidales bacterium]